MAQRVTISGPYKYELVEESTSESLTVSEVEDKNNPEQKTVTVDAAGMMELKTNLGLEILQ